MKKIVFYIILVVMILFGVQNVWAKDMAYSIKKYEKARFLFLEKSYDEEDRIDGMITAGIFVETKEEEDISNQYNSVILAKYLKNGKVAWTYTYEKIQEEGLIDFGYTYGEESKIDGYLVSIQKEEGQSIFLKLDLEGNLLWEKNSGLDRGEMIQKIIPTYAADHVFDGYIATFSLFQEDLKKVALIVRYDKDMNVVWTKEYQNDEMMEVEYADVSLLQENGEVTGTIVLRRQKNYMSEEIMDIIRFDLMGEETLLQSDIKTYESISLGDSFNGFILYGVTSDVKLKKGDASYYLLNYDGEGNLLWESVGEVAVSKEEKVLLFLGEKDYFLLYKNGIDGSYEVIQLDTDGLYVKKLKKIQNDYYTFENVSFMEDVLYFVGQIDCPEKDNCDYQENLLFLISDEDKVIEVKDNDSKRILAGIVGFVFLVFLALLFKRKQRM